MLNDCASLLHDNTHTARETQELLQKFKWEVWSHPPYSPDLATNLGSKHLSGTRFSSNSDMKTAAENWINSTEELYPSLQANKRNRDCLLIGLILALTNESLEFFNPIELSAIPSDKLRLKFGVPELFIRNLDVLRLRNGTRFQITHLGQKVVLATAMTGIARGESAKFYAFR
ncbi:hypothetical protein AVEN_170643-1 [Araneus ventricosus]|uniref:DNA helicase Pif1-like 2B domain-containing protein n=1 Tax=Araneus ventricosus TaxID=182803 RepID=A0A4Y2GZ88_ARAVE|nr:hypothetical protein AVEN_170643-1 [Araneus ventricosus]